MFRQSLAAAQQSWCLGRITNKIPPPSRTPLAPLIIFITEFQKELNKHIGSVRKFFAKENRHKPTKAGIWLDW